MQDNQVLDKNFCYDKPDKKQKHPHYEHRTAKLVKKDNEFSEKKFQRIRRVSTQKKLKKSFKRNGRNLEHVSRNEMPTQGYDKVCLILVNNFKHDKHDPKVGPMNDGYLFGLYHHRLGFKVFYLINCRQGNYPKYLQFFLFHTTENLTVYYSGRDTVDFGSHGVEFKDQTVSASQFGRLIARDNNGKCKVVFVSDCAAGGSVFDILSVNKVNNPNPSPMTSFGVNKAVDQNSKVGRRTHGIFTYYFCKILSEDPSISPKRMVERLNSSLARFNETVNCQMTNALAENEPMYNPCKDKPSDPVEEIIVDEDTHPEQQNDDDDQSEEDSGEYDEDDGKFLNESSY